MVNIISPTTKIIVYTDFMCKINKENYNSSNLVDNKPGIELNERIIFSIDDNIMISNGSIVSKLLENSINDVIKVNNLDINFLPNHILDMIWKDISLYETTLPIRIRKIGKYIIYFNCISDEHSNTLWRYDIRKDLNNSDNIPENIDYSVKELDEYKIHTPVKNKTSTNKNFDESSQDSNTDKIRIKSSIPKLKTILELLEKSSYISADSRKTLIDVFEIIKRNRMIPLDDYDRFGVIEKAITINSLSVQIRKQIKNIIELYVINLFSDPSLIIRINTAQQAFINITDDKSVIDEVANIFTNINVYRWSVNNTESKITVYGSLKKDEFFQIIAERFKHIFNINIDLNEYYKLFSYRETEYETVGTTENYNSDIALLITPKEHTYMNSLY